MKKNLALLLLVVLCSGLFAQWSTNAAFPNQLNPLTSTQVMPKTAVTEAGVTWVAWMDNLTGNYNTYLQKLNIMGVAEWTNPMLISNHPTMTWLTEWDIGCDDAGNVILTFQDIRLGTNNVVVYKISPSGEFLWGQDGILLSHDTSTVYSNLSPTLSVLPNGDTIVAWQSLDSLTRIVMHSISPNGDLLWGQIGVSLSSPSASYTNPQILPSVDNCFLLKYYEDTGPLWAPIRKMLVQKFNLSGQPLWASPTYVQNLGGITAWANLLSLTSDGLGGMVVCWYDDRNGVGISSAYVQRILVNGSVSMPINGAIASTETGYHQFYPKVAMGENNQRVYLFWNRVNADQNLWGIQAQKFNLSGERMWNGAGIPVEPLSSYSTYPISALDMEPGVVLLYSISPVPDNDQLNNLKVYCLDENGLPVWNAGLGNVVITMTSKLHFDDGWFQNLWGMVAWEDGTADTRIYAMRYNYNGSLGYAIPMPYNLSAQILGENDALLTWEFPNLDDMPIAFKVYRNGVFFHLVDASGPMQDIIHNIGPGLWSFYVTAVYQNGDESVPSNETTINITGFHPDETTIIPLSALLYPNPFRSGATLKFAASNSLAGTEISIYNTKGQLINRTSKIDTKSGEWRWDGNDSHGNTAPVGIYLIKLRQGEDSVTVKAVKY